MKKLSVFLLTLAILLAFGMTVVSCDDNGGGGPGGPGGSGSGALVGKWYRSQVLRDKADAAAAAGNLISYADYINLASSGRLPAGAVLDDVGYEFKSNGKLLVGGYDLGATYTATSNTITGGGPNYNGFIADYTISGDVLTLNQRNPENGGFTSGTYYKSRR